ncbi:hypothetical protein ACYSNW_08605 [Enterococcus sp. LJL99]
MESRENKPSIPRFSFKSSMLLLLAGIVGGIILPYLFFELGWDSRIAVMLFLPLLISLAIAYSQCFIETKDGLSKRFIRTFIIAFIVLETVSYFWLFKGFIF